AEEPSAVRHILDREIDVDAAAPGDGGAGIFTKETGRGRGAADVGNTGKLRHNRLQRWPESAGLGEPIGDLGRHAFCVIIEQCKSMCAGSEDDVLAGARDQVVARAAVERTLGGNLYLARQTAPQRSERNRLV